MSSTEDIVDSIRESGHLGDTGWWRTKCPFCEERTGKADRRGSLSVNSMSGKYHCFKCMVRGKADLPDDVAQDVDTFRAELPTEDDAFVEKPEGFYTLATEDNRHAETLLPARTYLRKRGITGKTALEVGIGACVDGFWGGRVVVPIAMSGEAGWRGFVARDWTGTSWLPYRYPTGMDRSVSMFNRDALFEETDEPLMICEGVFDALPYWPQALACLGKPIGAHHPWFMQARRPIAVVLDGDAHREGDALASILRLEGRRAGYVRLPPKSDPNSVDPDWLRQEVAACVTRGL